MWNYKKICVKIIYSDLIYPYKCLVDIINDYYLIIKSPLILPSINFYFGDIIKGTPIFLPRTIVKDKKSGKKVFKTKKFGFDIWGLGWKTKWSETDFRHEWNPGVSFVFFGKQLCVGYNFNYDNDDCAFIDTHFWETFLQWKYNTNKKLSLTERFIELQTKHCNIWSSNRGEINYYEVLIKSKYRHLIINKKKRTTN